MLSALPLNWVVGLFDVALLLLGSDVSSSASADEWLLVVKHLSRLPRDIHDRLQLSLHKNPCCLFVRLLGWRCERIGTVTGRSFQSGRAPLQPVSFSLSEKVALFTPVP